MDEAALVADATRGDLDAFNRLVLEYQGLAYNVACRILSDPHAAEDVTQTAFLAAYRNLKKFRGGSFRSWVMRIVTNGCYDELRRHQRHPEIPLEPTDSESEDEIDNPAWLRDEKAGPEEEFDRRQLNLAVQHCLNDLTDDFRSVVVLVDIEGMDYQEVSQIIDKPLGTIKSRLSRARIKLKECLKGAWEQLPVGLRLESEESL